MQIKILACIIILSSILFTNMGCSQNKYSELKEYGLNGKVKTVQVYNYSEIKASDNGYTPVNKDNWESSKSLYFNIEGELDSVVFEFRRNMDPGFYYSIGRIQYKYGEDGRKKSSKGKTLSILNNDTITLENSSSNFTWIDDYNYSEEEYTDQNNHAGRESKYELNKKFRDLKGQTKYFTGFGDPLGYYSYENSIMKNGLFSSSVETNHETGEITNTKYEYLKLDPKGNPLEIILWVNDGNSPKTLSLKSYTYWD